MRVYVLQRSLLVVPTLLVVTFLVFLITQVSQRDTAKILAGDNASPDVVAAISEEYGLDDPIPVQYVAWLGRLARGDLGHSVTLTRISIAQLLRERMEVTFELTILALLLSLIVSVPAGLLAALHRGSPFDLLVTSFTLAGMSFPSFVLSYLMIFFFAVKLEILPASGFTPLSDGVASNLEHMLMPSLALAAAVVAAQTRMMRTAALEVLETDYVRTARAKGLHPLAVALRHILRNALVPFVTIVGLQAAHLLGGSIIVESVFALPGLGTLAINSILKHDIFVVQAVVLLAVLAYMTITLLLDVAYAWCDPRIRFGR